MTNIFELADNIPELGSAVIKVIGVGGGGGNAVEHMVKSQVQGVDFICANTDKQALNKMSAKTLLHLGDGVTRGLGAGANPEVGRQAAVEDRDRIRESLAGSDMVFITAGMGGGTGTGGAPVIAEVAREMGILPVGVVTKPFPFEGKKRMDVADHGIEQLASHVDSLITIPNGKLLQVLGKVSLVDAFKAANNVLQGAVQGIADMILNPGVINVDFADVRTVMSEQGLAMMGTGSAKGEERARIATEMAIHSPLLDDVQLKGARGVLVSIAANESLGLDEFSTVGDIVSEFASESATVVIGTILDETLGDEIRVTVVATGLPKIQHNMVGRASIGQRLGLVPSAPVAAAAAVAPAAPAAAMAAGQPAAQVANAASAAAPSHDPYADLDTPAYLRNQKVANGGARRSDMNLLNIPAFLRRQAD